MSDFRVGSNLVSATFQALSSFRRLPPSDPFLLSSGRAVHGVGDGVVDVLHGIGGEEREVEGNGVLMPREGGKGREWVGCGPIVRWGRQGVAVQILPLRTFPETYHRQGLAFGMD